MLTQDNRRKWRQGLELRVRLRLISQEDRLGKVANQNWRILCALLNLSGECCQAFNVNDEAFNRCG